MIRYVAGAVAAVACIAAVGYVVHARWIAQPEPRVAELDRGAPRSNAVEAAVPHVIRVVRVEGTVERRAAAGWVAIDAGERLGERDTIRTAAGARALLDAGVTVVVEAYSEITVGEISAQVAEVELSEGRIFARSGGAGATIRILAPASAAVAEASAGEFGILSVGDQVSVSATEGSVILRANGEAVAVGAGQLSIVRRGEAPSAPTPIPGSLFLKVSSAGDAVTGEATPGTVVHVEGTRVSPDRAGRFVAPAPAGPPGGMIVVVVEDAAGRTAKKLVRRRPVAPKLEAKVEWE